MNILVLSSIYPSCDSPKGTTPVVHYFCKEWTKQGHNVIVVHNSNKYFIFFYLIPSKLKYFIMSKFAVILPNLSLRSKKIYEMDDVLIFRLPILKLIPNSNFFYFQIRQQLAKICELLDDRCFVPDVITGHWESPQIDLIFELKKRYLKAKTSTVIHLLNYAKSASLREKISTFDSIGFRNNSVLSSFQKNFNLTSEKYYLCYSGLPSIYYINFREDLVIKKFHEKVYSIVYVGLLINRKYPSSIILALNLLYGSFDFRLTFIGSGRELNNLNKLCETFNFKSKVDFTSNLTRIAIRDILLETQIFTMISSEEAFGLAYLEAMSCGCLVIASRNEGFDGIIIDGFNGFLCEAGNYKELAEIYKKITELSIDEKISISRNARKTTLKFSDSIVASNYLNSISK